jgi:hypothetical protein
MAKVQRMTAGLRSVLILAAAPMLLWGAGAEARPHPHGRHRASEPVVVELYTAQGCSGCNRANGVVADLAAKKELIPLTFSVDYWDYLGWEDTWAKSEFADRQRAYVGKLKVREIYTPEVVVQGAAEAPGWDRAKVDGLIAKAEVQKRHATPHIRLLHQRVRLEGEGPGGDVWLVRYNPNPQSVTVKAGESKGQTVTAKNTVHQLKKLGVWRGGFKTFALPKAEEAGLKTVILIQAPRGGHILAAARI